MYLLCMYVDINILQIYIFFLDIHILSLLLFIVCCILYILPSWHHCAMQKKRLGPYAICKVLQIPNANNCKLFVSWGRCTLTQHPKAGYEKLKLDISRFRPEMYPLIFCWLCFGTLAKLTAKVCVCVQSKDEKPNGSVASSMSFEEIRPSKCKARSLRSGANRKPTAMQWPCNNSLQNGTKCS